MARHRSKRCGPWLVQVRFDAGLTSEEYVKQKGWLAATLPFCPFHPEGGVVSPATRRTSGSTHPAA